MLNLTSWLDGGCPVSLTPIPGKCNQRVVLPYLLEAVGDKWDPLQFGFRKSRSPNTAVITVVDSPQQAEAIWNRYLAKDCLAQ